MRSLVARRTAAAQRSMATMQRSMPRAMRNANLPGIPTSIPKQLSPWTIGAIASGATALYIANQTVLFTDAGFIYVIQNNLSGSLSIKSEPGIHLRVPFFSNVTFYKQIISRSLHTTKQLV